MQILKEKGKCAYFIYNEKKQNIMTPLTIIISAYNKVDGLKLLFESLRSVQCDQKVDLVISIDNLGTKEVNALSESFKWHLGKKEVIIHKKKLGLINHFIWVGDQTEKYEHVLFLEDDFYVSPQILNYSLQVIPFYESDDRIAGCSFYNPQFTLSGFVFDKLADSYDNFFYQHPYWGNIWFKNKWTKFKSYLEHFESKDDLLPISVRKWRSGSFKRMFIQYLIETNRTIVYPRISLITNIGLPGLHSKESIDYVQVPIDISLSSKKYRFSSFDESYVKYDAYEELYPEVAKLFNPLLREYDFEIDTRYNRDHYFKDYVLTTRSVNHSLMSFSMSFKPYEYSILMNFEGDGIRLCHKNDLIQSEKDLSYLTWHSVRSHSPIDSTKYIPFETKRLIKNLFKKIFHI